MPVDGIAYRYHRDDHKAHTSPEVKQLLVKTPGIPADAKSDDVFAPQAAHWVPSGKSVGGMSSGLSHLHADIYELENDSAECGRLLVRVMKHPEELDSRRKEIIEALNKTAKPYFGDLASMTYLEWAQRFAELAFPWVDPTYADRFQHLLQRIEARVNDTDSGEFTSKLFAADGVSAEEAAAADLLTHDDILADPAPALEKLALAYPQTAELKVVSDRRGLVPGARAEYWPACVRARHRQRPAALVGSGPALAVRRPALLRRFRACHPRPDLRGRHHHHRRADRRHPRPLRNRRHQARAGRTAGRRCR